MNEMECRIEIINGRDSDQWWRRAAAEVAAFGHIRFIRGLKDPSVKLARFWLSPPRNSNALAADEIESGDSLLLHWIIREDDDAPHDHPWGFSSTILSGGYVEESHGLIAKWSAGDRVSHGAFHLHRITQVQPDTWTLVETKPKDREWGFIGDDGKWTPHREYIARFAAEGRR